MENIRSHEVTRIQDLLDRNGEIAEPGWARRQVARYRRAAIKAPAFRIKEWDYYLVMGRDFAAAFTLSDDGYIGLQSVSLLLLGEQPWEHTETILNVLPMGNMKMPETTDAGDVHYTDKRLDMHYTLEEKDGRKFRHITCRFKDFTKGKPLSADILLEQPEMDSMVIATPWDKKHAVYYNQKINCMRASGHVQYDGKDYVFCPETDFGTLDWGRGVWTYDNTWYWGSGNCDLDGHAFGFNIGYGFGNTAAASENVIFYDGKAHKIDDVKFEIPNDTDPKDMEGPDYMKPWRFTSSDGRFEMEFEPVLDRAAKIDIKLICSDQHQVFGRLHGKAVLDDGTVLEIPEMLCFAEKVHNRY